MTLLRLPMFGWTTLVTSVLLLFSIPVVTAGLDHAVHRPQLRRRVLRAGLGGNPVLWQHVFWFFGHPEVNIPILPAFGIVSETVPVFSRKPLFGYRAFVLATAAIGDLRFTVWATMFTTGAVYLPFFSFFTFLIAIPTGIKFFNWLATMWGGQLTFDTPLLYAVGFIALFLIGGLDGAFLAVVPFDFMVQDTYFVVSHIHYVLVAGAVFGIFAGLFDWFPKITGKKLNERMGKIQFWLLFIGTNVAFFPQHLLGLDGMVRRIADYSDNPGWAGLNFLSTIGAFIIAVSVLPFLWNVFVTLRGPADAGDDPWDAYTLEWATSSPPPVYNFDHLPPVRWSGRSSISSTPSWHTQPVTSVRPVCPPRRGTTHDRGPRRHHRACRYRRPRRDRDRRPRAGVKRGMDTALLGMMLFIASEVMFFAALFGAYFNVRATTTPWPPEGTEFISPYWLPIIVTIILMTSSFTMQWATMRIRKGDRTGMNRGIAVTLLLGIIFLCLQVYDYYNLVTNDLFGINSGVTARCSTP